MQIAHTRFGVQTILEHIVSGHDDAQLASLVQIADEQDPCRSAGVRYGRADANHADGVAPTVVGCRSLEFHDGRLGLLPGTN